MSKSIIIDPGHGGTDPGAIGFGVREKDWNLRISLYQYERLKALGAKVAITRTDDRTLDSVPRTNLIKGKYDICISNHWNAFNGSARGVETIYSINQSGRLATNIANALVKETGIPLRRVFTRKNNYGTNYYFMHRLTGGTNTVIVEYGFMDNRTDFNWYANKTNFYKAAEVVIKEICEEAGVTYRAPGSNNPPSVPKPSATGTLYRVQAGAFKNVENANALHQKMQDNGIEGFVLEDNGLFKVQAGAYSVKKNAEAQLERVKKVAGSGFVVSTSGSVGKVVDVKPTPPKATPSKQTVHLPKTAKTWRVYDPRGPYSKGNEIHMLTPSAFANGITYDIKGNPAPDVYLVDTGVKGRVALYAGPGTGAKVSGTSTPTSTPKPKPAPAPKPSGRTYKQNGTFYMNDTIIVRDKASTSGKIIARYHKGEQVTYHTVHETNGYVWLQYNRGSGGQGYIPCRTFKGGKYGPLWGTIK